jgi:DNA polymerase-3 subunit alpha
MDFKVLEVRLLEGIALSMTESITLKLPLERISADIINDLDGLCRTHVGPHKFKVEILDHASKTKVNMVSLDRKVNADNDFIRELGRLGLEYVLN